MPRTLINCFTYLVSSSEFHVCRVYRLKFLALIGHCRVSIQGLSMRGGSIWEQTSFMICSGA
jgi:hypothetical protein